MKHELLEKELTSKAKKRRMIEIILCTIFFIIAVSFGIAHLMSMNVEEVSVGEYFAYRNVTYNDSLVWGILVGWLGFIPCAALLIEELIFTKFITVEVGEHFVTYSRGFLHELYVNGELKDRSSWDKHYLEGVLPDGVRINVALGRRYSHISFSNGQPSVDV